MTRETPLNQVESDLKRYACAKLARYAAQIRCCVQLLSPDELWQRPNLHCNAVGNLVLHLAGNVCQWIVGGLGGRDVARDRAAEFAARGGLDGAALLNRLEPVVRDACQVIRALSAESLARPATIQGYEVSGCVALVHVLEHFAYHTGQIIHATKSLRNVDLSLYDVHGQLVDADDRTTP